MKITKINAILIMLVLSILVTTQAQGYILAPGDPPRPHHITIEQINQETVQIRGAEGAVFPSAKVGVRNIYTGESNIVQARVNGSFEAMIGGSPQMPYQVHAAQSFPQQISNEAPMPGTGTILYPNYNTQNLIPFAIGGRVSYGAQYWYGEGRISRVILQAGERIELSLNVQMYIPDADPTLPYTMVGTLSLQSLFSADDHVNTPTPPLQVASLEGKQQAQTINIAQTQTDRIYIDEETDLLRFRLNFVAQIPDDLADGLYIPSFTGQASIANSNPFDWYDNRVFSTVGTEPAGNSSTIFPFPLRIGSPPDMEIPIHLVNPDHPRYDNGLATPGSIQIQPGENKLLPQLARWPMMLPIAESSLNNQPTQIMVYEDKLYLWSENTKTLLDTEGYGSHILPMNVTITDPFGSQYGNNQIILIHVAEPLTLSPTVLPGTPLQIGNTFPVSGNLAPVFSGDIELEFWHSGSPEEPRLISGKVNPYGYFALEPMPLEEGLYTALWRAETKTQRDEQAWYQEMQYLGSISQPGAVASGMMGLADYQRNPQAWFDTRAYPSDAPGIAPFVNFPYFQGDTAYIPDHPDAGINPALHGEGIHILSIVRPDVPLRHIVRQPPYLSDDRLHNDESDPTLIGIGREGNRPQDILFLFGNTIHQGEISGYSALAIVTDEESARVVPAFSEAILHNQDLPISMTLIPTGVRPGQILEVGDRFVHAGYIAPTLGADVYSEITTPTGERLVQETKANEFGFFYEPSHDFSVQETGVYRVYTEARYNGITSSGQLRAPVTGTSLGADVWGYFIFVVPQNEPQLNTPYDPVTQITAGQILTINVRAPQEWSDVRAYYVVRTPSTILEEGSLDTFSNQTNYQFNWPQISRRIPNIEPTATHAADIDEITFSFAMTGLTPDGTQQIRARVFTLRGNTLYTAEQEEQSP